MQNKGSKNKEDKIDEDSNSCDEENPKDSCKQTKTKLEKDELSAQDFEEKTKTDEKMKEEKCKKKKLKKKASELEENCQVIKKSSDSKQLMPSFTPSKQQKMSEDFEIKRNASLETKLNDLGESGSTLSLLAKNISTANNGNLMSSHSSKNSFATQMTPNSVDTDRRSLANSNHSSSPPIGSPSSWRGETLEPSHPRFSRQTQELDLMSRRDSRLSATESYRESYDSIHYPTPQEYAGADSIQEMNPFSQNYSQRSSSLSSYPTNSFPHSNYRSSYSGLERSFSMRSLNSRVGPNSHDVNNKYFNSNFPVGSSPSTEAASVMAAVYMNSRNPHTHYANQGQYQLNSSSQFQSRNHPMYDEHQQPNYGSNLSPYC